MRKTSIRTQEPSAALHQLLGRWPNINPNAKPTMFDLKYAKDLARDAHVVLLLYRPEEKGIATGNDEIIIGKMREGQRGSIKVRFDQRRMEFRERLP